jgi:hypothetical protein
VKDNTDDFGDDQTEEALTYQASDEELEAAAGTPMRGVPTVFHVTHCFGCPN